MLLKKYGLWIAYFAFVVLALVSNWHASMLDFSLPLAGAKALLWLILLGFLSYSLYASGQENIAHIIRTMAASWWGRQIGIDLYLGLMIVLLIIYLNQGLVVMLLWFVPVLIFANLAALLYMAIHFDHIVGLFLS